MGNPKTEGRMINRSISDSEGFAALSPGAAVLFCMIIPHLNGHGKMHGGAAYLKEEVCPLIKYINIENIPSFMAEITEHTNVKWFQSSGRWWIHSLKFLTEHQNLNQTRLGRDLLPDYSGVTPDLVQSRSGVGPDQVTHEVEVEVEVEEEVEAARVENLHPVDNSEPEPEPDIDPEPEAEQKTEPLQEDDTQQPFFTNLKTVLKKLEPIYPSAFEQRQIMLFVEANIRTKNHDAIIHSLTALIEAHKKGNPVKNLKRYLDAVIAVESQNYNAAEHEKASEEFKKPPTPEGMMVIGSIMAAAQKKTQAVRNRGQT